MSKKGQGIMGIPFQLIFSLILIALFLYAAIFGIRYFLERADQAKVGQFIVGLESKVNIAWQTTEMSSGYSFTLPSKIEKVCFWDVEASSFNPFDSSACPEFEIYKDQARLSKANMFFCPPVAAYSVGSPVFARISCDDVDCLEFSSNPYCIDNVGGTVKINLAKYLGEAKVRIN